MFGIKKKNKLDELPLNKQQGIEFAKKIADTLPEEIVNQEENNKTSNTGNKYKINLSIEEVTDKYVDLYIESNPKIYKYVLILIVLNAIIMLSTTLTLVLRADTKFFASAPDGRTWELTTRETPNGSFKIIDYQGRK